MVFGRWGEICAEQQWSKDFLPYSWMGGGIGDDTLRIASCEAGEAPDNLHTTANVVNVVTDQFASKMVGKSALPPSDRFLREYGYGRFYRLSHNGIEAVGNQKDG